MWYVFFQLRIEDLFPSFSIITLRFIHAVARINSPSPFIPASFQHRRGDPGSVPGTGRFPGEGKGNPLLQYSMTEEPGGLDSLGSQKSQTQLSDSTAAAAKGCASVHLLFHLLMTV